MLIAPARVHACTLTTALGQGVNPHLQALADMRPGLRPCTLDGLPVPAWAGMIDGLDDLHLPEELARFDCRNNRLAELALTGDDFLARVRAARETWGPTRIGLFLGTSTSGIRHTEQCYQRHFEQDTPGLGDDLRFGSTHAYVSLVDYCRRRLGLRGPACVISTACSSGAKTFAAAHRALSAGICDAAVVGGVDTLCLTTAMGFHALGLLSPRPCNPWGQGRTGISIGEGAAFALLGLESDTAREGLALLGYGESSDAYHITSPHPEGAGAERAMRAALETAGLTANEIDYVNLHGTGTPANDLSEDRAVTAVFGDAPIASATKGWTGHTLGASGAVEAVLSLICLRHGLIPGTLNMTTLDPDLSVRPIRHSRRQPIARALSNSFGFAGNNCALLFGRV
ncbi:beta-ketoacyl-ACP synthase [Thiocystis violascens]|uniref:3-oxoacyl-(Acyl-carrier-protein) synthase n=1 Tax=Thiocystis violascens (strain ATCC 17096 / DSM 198 / 6111) TaxID=765911 RepID=I3YB35_THIV6|nr:beta-ketoacyl-ACP synthase [Thiocystis violascens]AFL74203.1 3-oxoacyl-(acyl-carrier-protein) synthase [Thiocystis violascens DSM 198]